MREKNKIKWFCSSFNFKESMKNLKWDSTKGK